MAETTSIPTITQSVDQRYLIEPLGGDREPRWYMDRFPEEVYNKHVDSHLVKFLYALIGPAGVGGVKRNFLQTRLIYEASGLELFDLDRFYGNPFQFGRIADEAYTEDVLGLLPQEDWERIRSKDARYRNRIIDFLAGARAGNTPFGMRLVARSGLGHEVEVIENYKSLFDQNSDDRLDLPYVGQTRYLNEFIILPRQEVSRSEVQKITIFGSPTSGTFTLNIAGSPRTTEPLPFNASRQQVEDALATALQVPRGNITVQGGPLPDAALHIRFVGDLAAQNLTQLEATNQLVGGQSPQIVITTTQQGFDGSTEVVHITPRDQYHLQEAIDRIRPVGTIPTVAPAAGTQSRINWVRASASSEFDEMVRYVTGNGRVLWPQRDRVHWIEGGVEHQALRAQGDLPYHYRAFHDFQAFAYIGEGRSTVEYLTPSWFGIVERFASEHFGSYNKFHSAIFPFLRSVPESSIMRADQIGADYAEPLHVTRVVEVPGGSVGLINGMYPTDYQSLPGVPGLRYPGIEQFWSSRETTDGDECVEIDLGDVRAINYLSFELTRKPLGIQIDYDVSGMTTGERQWQPVTYSNGSTQNQGSYFSPTELNPWREHSYYFGNKKSEMIFTRYVRITFSRRVQSDFLSSGVPWSVDARNLRIGRVVSNQ